jgi:hypothetical protein
MTGKRLCPRRMTDVPEFFVESEKERPRAAVGGGGKSTRKGLRRAAGRGEKRPRPTEPIATDQAVARLKLSAALPQLTTFHQASM